VSKLHWENNFAGLMLQASTPRNGSYAVVDLAQLGHRAGFGARFAPAHRKSVMHQMLNQRLRRLARLPALIGLRKRLGEPVGDITKKEDAWLRRASAAAVAEARAVVLGEQSLTNAQAGRLSDVEWAWIINAAIFGWIKTRIEQAIEEGSDQETAVRLTDQTPSPSEVAVVHSVLPTLCDQAKVDWSQPLMGWSKDSMTNFLLLAWRLIDQAEVAQRPKEAA
jgi:hypothetical protein